MTVRHYYYMFRVCFTHELMVTIMNVTVTGTARKCDWCERMSTHGELILMTHDRQSKRFCSEDCQDLFKDDILKNKVWTLGKGYKWALAYVPKD